MQFLRRDDLKLIEGVGPKVASLLNGVGIATFARLAGSGRDRTEARARRRAAPDDQSRDMGRTGSVGLPAGRWDALQALQSELKGGLRR